MTVLEELLDSIFDSKKPALYAEFEDWARDSRRFRAFASSYRNKIRNKLKNVRDEGGMQDLRAELQAAMVLLRAEQFTLEYEKYAASKQRGPDFTVTFKSHTHFNVEVRRLRSVELDDGDAEARTGKLMRVLCDKVGQMPPSIVNLLWLSTEREIPQADLTRAVTTLRQLADHKAEDFFVRRGLASATDFLAQYRRLSGIVLRQSGMNMLWLNPLARHHAPPDIVTTIQRLDTLSET